MKGDVLFVDDEPEALSLVERRLSKRGYHVTAATSAEQALELLEVGKFDVVVTDLRMPGMDGLELCTRILGRYPRLPVILLTAFGNLETAVGAIRSGAYDFVTKPLEVEVLTVALDRAIQHCHAHRELERLRAHVGTSTSRHGIVGNSPAIGRVIETVDRIANVDASLLLTGESGTGKEVVAQAIHRTGARRGGPFVAINCSAIPENLLESELFGHAQGAFTDARTARAGLFSAASGGTLFLDEIGDLPLSIQPKLLRVLQERRVRPVGANVDIPVDVRIISATNLDLERAVAERRFREDLFYRVNVIHIELPPLRERGNDVLVLAEAFLRRNAAQLGKTVHSLSPAVAERLMAHHWPGNVRELENCIERAVALARHVELVIDDLPERLQGYFNRVEGAAPVEWEPLETVELRYVRQVYAAVGGNKTLAAQTLGLDRKTLYRKLEQCGALGNKDS